MYISVHITKTGGNTVRWLMQQVYGADRIVQWYGVRDEKQRHKTHPELVNAGKLDSEVIRGLSENGAQILHGHFKASDLIAAFPEPWLYMTWIREPVERVISLYSYLSERNEGIAVGTSLEEFIEIPKTQNNQTRMLSPLHIEDMAFVGITERLDDVLVAMGTKPKRMNATQTKIAVSSAVRARIAELNADDMGLYERASAIPLRPLPAPHLQSG